MADIDLPGQDKLLTATPADVRRDMAELGRNDLFFLSKGVLGYSKLKPAVHGPVGVFINHNEAQFKLILMPRDHFKTSYGTISGTIQRVVRNTNERCLIANESATNAERMLRAIRQHAESNNVFRTIYSDIIPKDTRALGLRWNDHELDFIRTWIGPEPTIDTIGMTGAFTSRHYTYITADDPISEEAIKSPKIMEDTIERIKGFLSLLVEANKDPIVFVGTRWALHDLYSWIIKNLGPRLAVYAVGVFDANGDPIFPELMSSDTLALKRAALGEYRFSCLYLNNPRNEDIQDFNVGDIKAWRWSDIHMQRVELLEPDGSTKQYNIDQLDVTCTVDLAPAETVNSDRNAITVVGNTPNGEMVVLDTWAKRCKPSEVIEQLFTVNRRFRPRVFGIEDVAYQKAFKHFLKEECERRFTYLNTRPIKALGKKITRMRGLQPIVQSGRFYLRPDMHLARTELAEIPLGEHDDVADSLSMHLQIMTGALSANTIAARQAGVAKAVQHILHPELGDDNDYDVWHELNRTRESAAIDIK